VRLRVDATEVRVRRPRAGRPARKAFVSGKAKQNTIKTTVVSDARGDLLWCGSTRPAHMHDLTAVRTEGIDALINAYPQVQVLVDTGYQDLARDHPEQVSAPLLKPHAEPPLARHLEWKGERKQQSSQRIPVEHAIAEAKWWRVLQRFTGRRDLLPETITAIAGLVSDRQITW
jgi:DDE superfamily endonuclease